MSQPGPSTMDGEVIYDGQSQILPGQLVPSSPGEISSGPLMPEMMSDGIMSDGMMSDGMMYGGSADCCGGVGCVACICPTLCFNNFEFFSGVDGFTGPKNRGGSGSFGFHYGTNWGAPLFFSCGALGMQVGARGVHSNFSGTSFNSETRDQVFVTGGIFRRVDWGFQGGVVLDYQHDGWYTDTDLLQLRGELSWVCPQTHELGFRITSSTNSDTATSVLNNVNPNPINSWESTDLYAFFYRHRFAMYPDASARIIAGFSDSSDGLIGTDVRIPLSNNLAMETGFSYLVPKQAATGMAGGGHEQESWNIGINLVWYPGARSASGNDYYRPLFNVADNSNFMVDRTN